MKRTSPYFRNESGRTIASSEQGAASTPAVTPESAARCLLSLTQAFGHMILALANDDRSLFLFESLLEAESEFEAIDVANGEYEFRDQMGRLFIPEITAPITAFHPGRYHLVPQGADDREALLSILSRSKILARCVGQFRTVGDLRRALLAEPSAAANAG